MHEITPGQQLTRVLYRDHNDSTDAFTLRKGSKFPFKYAPAHKLMDTIMLNFLISIKADQL